MQSKLSLAGLACAAAALASASAAAGQSTGERFSGMDANHDGVITRAEWRGSERSFEVHDWNRDGVLSGDELRAGQRRDSGWSQNSDDENGRFTEWTEERFRNLDHDGNGRLTRDEWHFDAETFRRVDRDGNGWLSRSEFLGLTGDDDRDDRFVDLDWNGDGRVTRDEWHGDPVEFGWLDRDRNNVLTRDEVGDDGAASSDRFASLDVDRNGRLSPNEWHWSRAAFDRRDTNRDGSLSREEFAAGRGVGTNGSTRQSDAYRAGAARGLADGRRAGAEDKRLRNRWDLEGQRELEQADAEYTSNLGPRADYQDAYREAFRRGYREGFGTPQSDAYKAGAARGLADGRHAGAEDKRLRNRWDLEGQRELEQADAGYSRGVGSRSEYQEGYREAFRRGYREGFGPR